MPPPVRSAVLLIAFNRPDLTRRVVDAVRLARPARMYLAADGPRPHRPDDSTLCAEARAELERIDWPCSIARKYEDENLGCGRAVSSAISWVLDAEQEAVILEDDCVPDPTLFAFCDELLDRYRDDERVMQIAGSNWGASPGRFLGASYGFASFPSVWGWATWARAWRHYDISMARWPEFRDSGLLAGLPPGWHWRRQLRDDWEWAHSGKGTWDHQWQFCVYQHHGLSATPAVNLVTNLGFRPDATQTTGEGDDLGAVPVEPMRFPLRHPPEVVRNPLIDAVYEHALRRRHGLAVKTFRLLVPSKRARDAIQRLPFVRGRRR